MSAPELHLGDAETVADLTTYVGRARVLDPDGAVRLQASARTLAVWVGVLRGRGLTGEGTVLGLRVLPLAAPADLDKVVPLAAVSDRLARGLAGGTRLPVPPTTVRAGWAAVSPPRSGWQPLGGVSTTVLAQAARDGIAEVAQGVPDGAGSAAVDQLRARVWGRALPTGGGPDGLPAGVALGAHALGFLVGDTAQVLAAGRWFRLSTPAGHVLVR